MRRKILTAAIGIVLAAAILIVAVSMVDVSGEQTEIWKNGERLFDYDRIFSGGSRVRLEKCEFDFNEADVYTGAGI